MTEWTWTISFAFPYPSKCTRKSLTKTLADYAAHWPGWDKFPWRITRDIHNFIDEPQINFHYLMTQVWLTTFASHLVLHESFANRDDLLNMLIRERFEFVGVFRHHLIAALQFLRAQEVNQCIPDCTPTDDGQIGVTPEELERRRTTFRAAVERAAQETVRVLNYASQEPNMNRHIAGHTLRTWSKGDDMPPPQELKVALNQREGQTFISPTREEGAQFTRVRKTIPSLAVRGLSAQFLRRVEVPKAQPALVDPAPVSHPATLTPPATPSIIGDFKAIRVGPEVIDLAGRHKLRAFLRYIHQSLRGRKARDFYVDELRDAFNATIPDDNAGRRWKSDRFREDLFKGLEPQFDLLFETLDKAAGHYRLRF